jgi:hypothetical protein
MAAYIHVSLFSLHVLIPYKTAGRKRCLHHALSYSRLTFVYAVERYVPPYEEMDYELSTSVCPKRDSMRLPIVRDTTRSQESAAEKNFRLGS